DFRGKTDPRIVWDLMTGAGLPAAAIGERLAACFEAYVAELEALIGDGARVKVMPGIADVVRALSVRADAVVGLLTGNIEAGARRRGRAAGGALGRFAGGALSAPTPPPAASYRRSRASAPSASPATPSRSRR